MNYFARLPLKIRFPVVLCFLVASVVVGIIGRPSRTLLLAAALLFISGGWRISKARSFVLVLILVPALVGLLLTHFDWHHPFLIRYSAGLFSVIAALLLMDGIRIEEWIEIVRGKPGGPSFSGLGPLLIGTAVGTISLSSNIQEQRTCRRLANVYSWRAKSRASIFLDGIALPFYNAVESHEFIDEALHRWSPRDGGATGVPSGVSAPVDLVLGNSSFTARISDLNDFPLFTDIRAAVLSALPIPEPWTRGISQLSRPARILEIGDHGGQFTNHLLEQGFDIIVLTETHPWNNTLYGTPRRGASFRSIDASLEDAPIPECDHIFLHHNSFLEAVNRLDIRAVLSRLHQLSTPNAHICFDYPATVMPATQGAILSGKINGVGQVQYGYSHHQQDKDVHRAWLEYTVRQEHQHFCVRVPLRFAAPELAGVLAVAREAGFSYSTSPMPGSFSFLAGELAFVELQKREGNTIVCRTSGDENRAKTHGF